MYIHLRELLPHMKLVWRLRLIDSIVIFQQGLR